MTALHALVTYALDVVEAGGAVALAVVMAVESLFPPVPSELVLPLAGFGVQQHRLTFAGALGAATAGSVAGAWILYAVSRAGGRPLLYRWGWLLRVDVAQLDRADAWLDRHGVALVFWARMVPLARSVVSVPAGMSRMPFWRFTVLSAAGSLLWNALLIGAGMAAGSRWRQVADIVGSAGWLALGVAALAAVALGLRMRRRMRTCNGVSTVPARTMLDDEPSV